MKYCSHCGAEVADDAVICVSCGRQIKDLQTPETVKEVNPATKFFVLFFMILSCIGGMVLTAISGWWSLYLIMVLAFTIVTGVQFSKNEPIGVGVKICILLFVNTIAGIILLCSDC